MSRTIRVGIVFGLVLALALSAGCAQIAEKAARGAVEKATGVKVDEKGESVTLTGKDGESVTFTGGEGKLPEGLPSDFPVYAGTPEGSGAASGSDGKTFTFTVLTTDSVDTVFEWYKTELTGAAWSIENSMTAEVNGAKSASLSAKKDLKEAMITIGGDESKGDKVSIGVILNEKLK